MDHQASSTTNSDRITQTRPESTEITSSASRSLSNACLLAAHADGLQGARPREQHVSVKGHARTGHKELPLDPMRRRRDEAGRRDTGRAKSFKVWKVTNEEKLAQRVI